MASKGSTAIPSEDEILEIFKAMMQNCKLERTSREIITNAELAKKMGITSNHLSAIESARAKPSILTFLKYLMIVGFDLRCFRNLTIATSKPTSELMQLREELSDKINTLDENQLAFLLEQVKVSQILRIKVRRIQEST